MGSGSRTYGVHSAWWTAILVATIVVITAMTCVFFTGSLNAYVPVTLTADRSGLVMEPGAKVKLRGVQVGVVGGVGQDGRLVSLQLKLRPDQLKFIPANVGAQIKANTAFGAKYVDFVMPDDPSPQRLTAGAIVHSRNVSTEVNTVFENLTSVIKAIDPAKLNAVLSAFAEGVRGQGRRIGEATTDANDVLLALNPRMATLDQDWRSLAGFSDAYSAAAPDILKILSAASTTSTTITGHEPALDALLLNTIGLSRAGIDLLAPNGANLVKAVNVLVPTTDLLAKYNPEYTCLILGAKWVIDNLGDALGGDGKSSIGDAGILLGSDLYRYPENLPLVAAKGGPGGKPGCGSLPDPSKAYPVRYMVTNTGWGTVLDVRPNPGISHPFFADYFPVTRAVPEPPSIRGQGPYAPGPVPYPGAPPYGAPQHLPPPPAGVAPGPQPPLSFPGPQQ
jgi:phospholipid/cholesterol/gamma-HCH transport system substrate-binding protein